MKTIITGASGNYGRAAVEGLLASMAYCIDKIVSYGVDINRAAARGKPFWHAERQGGPLWLQPQVIA